MPIIGQKCLVTHGNKQFLGVVVQYNDKEISVRLPLGHGDVVYPIKDVLLVSPGQTDALNKLPK